MTQINEGSPGRDSSGSESLGPGYFMLAGQAGDGNGGITLLGLWNVFWSQRLLIIGIGSLFAIGSIIIALLMTPIYRVDSTLAPVEANDMPDIASRLGGLASLSGIRMSNSSDGGNAVAILRSRKFAAEFITEKELMPLIYEDRWDGDAGTWISDNPEEIPQIYDAVKYFHESVFSVKEDPLSGLVTIAVEWKDPEIAAEWVNSLVERINRETRARALYEAETNLSYLQIQLETASVVELRSAIYRIIESEIKTIMIANAREQYAFRVIDPGMVPTNKIRPRRSLIVITATFLGGLLALVLALMRHTLKHQLSDRDRSASPTSAAS